MTEEPFLIGDSMTGGYGGGPDILHGCTILCVRRSKAEDSLSTTRKDEKVVRETERSRSGSRSFSRISLRDFSGVMNSG